MQICSYFPSFIILNSLVDLNSKKLLFFKLKKFITRCYKVARNKISELGVLKAKEGKTRFFSEVD